MYQFPPRFLDRIGRERRKTPARWLNYAPRALFQELITGLDAIDYTRIAYATRVVADASENREKSRPERRVGTREIS